MVTLRQSKDTGDELEQLLEPRKRSGLFNMIKKNSNKSPTRSDEKSKTKGTNKVKAKEPVHHRVHESHTPPLSPESSESSPASPVSNINIEHHNNSSKDHNNSDEDEVDANSDEEKTMFSDITDNHTYMYNPNSSSNHSSPASSPDRDKSKANKANNSITGQKNTKVMDPPGASVAASVIANTAPDAPGNLNTTEAMKERMRNRQSESACCGTEDTTVDDTTFVSKMFACNVPGGANCHVPGGAYALDTAQGPGGDNRMHTQEQHPKTYAQQQQQQQQQQDLRKVLSFTPVWGVAPSMDDDDRALSPSRSPTPEGTYSYSNTNTNTNPYNTYSQSRLSQSQSTRSTESPRSAVDPDGIEYALEDYHVEDKDDGDKESVRRGWRHLFQKPKGDGSSSSPARTTTDPPSESPSRLSRSKSSPSKSPKSRKSKSKTPPPPPPLSSAHKKERNSNGFPTKIRYERMPEEEEEKKVEDVEVEEDFEAKQRRLAASMQEELVAARAAANHKKRERKKASKEARYKHLLSNFKGSPKRTSLLETVEEGDGEQEGPKPPNENTEMKVRVPGMDQMDSFLTDEDLVGAEFIEEDSGDQEDEDDYISDESDDEDEVQPVPAAKVPDEPVTESVADAVADEETTEVADEETTVEQAVPEPAVVVEEKRVVEEKHKLWLAQIVKVDTQKLWLERVAKIVKVPGENVVPPPTPKRVHLENPNPFRKSNSSPKKDNGSSIHRTRSWYERLGLKKVASYAEDDIKSSDSVSLARNRSAPVALARNRSAPGLKNSSKANISKKKPKKSKDKPLWKATIDESSGLTYYYHRVTRQTTWTKPGEFDQPPPSFDEEDDIEKVQDFVESEEQIAKKKEIMETLRKQSSRDFDPEVWKTKNKIVDILTTMAPPDGQSIERLMKSYEGSEEILLTNLRDLSESRPFDEPIKSASTGSPDDVSKFDDKSPERSTFDGMRSRSGATSLLSGFSGITKVSEQTELIRNTAWNTPRHNLDSSFETDGSNNDVHGLGEPRCQAQIPSKIPVPRSRELRVEEFTTNERIKAETFAGSAVVRARKSYYREDEEEPSFFSVFDLGPYLGDNDDTTDVDTVTDAESVPTAISGLSEAHSTSDEFVNRMNDGARRRALDEAIAKEDWDLAADLSEGLRANTKSKSMPRRVPKEWTQSELDKFISENDWDAVANYIAQVRDSAKASSRRNETAAQTSSQRKLIGPVNPKKRFGALSQLQHGDINSDSSWDSDASSYYSDDYSSGSSYTDEDDPLYMAANSKRRAAKKEFTC
jgi:hypothetical protein